MWIGGEGGIRTHGVTTPLLSTTSRLAEAHLEVEVIESCWPLRRGAFGCRDKLNLLNLTGAFLQLTATTVDRRLAPPCCSALEQPFAGITRIQPDAFTQLAGIFKDFSQPGADESR
jgi:hypothetical protein